MKQVQTRRASQGEEAIRPLLDEMQQISDEVRQRAFSLFQQRGCEHGRDLEDWLEAEKQVAWAPPVETVEQDHEFQLQLALPGTEAPNVEIIALPDSITVHGLTASTPDRQEGDLFSESGERKLFCRICLSAEIDPDQVTARLEKGMLRIVAQKANRPDEGKIAASA